MYVDGKIVYENDSINQIYLSFCKDNSYSIVTPNKVEKGKWRTKDYDDFDLTYIYSNTMDYILGLSTGELTIKNTSGKVKVFAGYNWRNKGQMARYDTSKTLFCQSGYALSKAEISKVLKVFYGE